MSVGAIVILGILCVFAWWAWGLAGAVAICLAWALARFQDRIG